MEIAATAARMVVEEGLEYGPAKKRAVKQLGLAPRTPLPDNDAVEDAVREYISLFCADTQPVELAALRQLALTWMERLAQFRPHLGGANAHARERQPSILADQRGPASRVRHSSAPRPWLLLGATRRPPVRRDDTPRHA